MDADLHSDDAPQVDAPTWKFIWALIRFQGVRYIFNNLAMFATTLGDLVPGLVSREVFNLLSAKSPTGFNLWTLLALLGAGALVQMGGVGGLIRTNVPFQYRIQALLHKNILGRILERPGARSLPEAPGKAISRFREDAHEIPWFALWLNDLFGFLVFTVVAVAAMFWISPSVTLIAFLPFVGVALLAHAATSRVEGYRRASRETTGRVVGFIAETFGAAQAVKVAGAEGHVVGHFRTLNEARRKAALKDRLFEEVLRSVFWNMGNVGTGVILLLAAPSMRAGAFTVGDFALFAYCLGYIAEGTGFLGFMLARYKQAGVSIARMVRLLQGAPPETLVTPGPIYMDGELPAIPFPEKTGANRLDELEVRGLTYQYTDYGAGIRDIDLTLPRGSFTVVTGRIGSGKTTLLRALLGLLPKDAGEIRWNGKVVNDPAAFFVPPRSAYIAQVPRLFSDTLRENLLLGLPEDRMDLPAAIRAAVLEQDIEALENGLDTKVGPKGVRLSGGQIQRSAAARMFARNPELLVFDDLSSALDVETEKALWERLDATMNDERGTTLAPHAVRCKCRSREAFIVDLPGRVASPRRPPPRRSHHRAQGWARGGRGDAGRVVGDLQEMRRLWAGEAADGRET